MICQFLNATPQRWSTVVHYHFLWEAWTSWNVPLTSFTSHLCKPSQNLKLILGKSLVNEKFGVAQMEVILPSLQTEIFLLGFPWFWGASRQYPPGQHPPGQLPGHGTCPGGCYPGGTPKLVPTPGICPGGCCLVWNLKCTFLTPAPEGRTETLQMAYLPQMLAEYIQYQLINSTDIL